MLSKRPGLSFLQIQINHHLKSTNSQTQDQRTEQVLNILFLRSYSLFMGDCTSRGIKTQDIPKPQTEPKDNIWPRLITQKRKAQSQTQMYQLLSEYFDTFDTDGDGILSYKEIQTMLKRMQKNTNKRRKDKIEISEYEIRSFFSKIDVTGDHKINKEEFYRFYKSR